MRSRTFESRNENMDTEFLSYKRRAFDALCNLFSFRLQRSTKRLMNLKCGDDDERYAKKAVEILVRKLKKQALEDLECALNNPKVSSKCVLMQKFMDNKTDGLHRQVLPHVTYCRIWRWPDLKSNHELQPLSICKHAHSVKAPQNEFCINPYHYKRLITPELPPVVIPKKTEYMFQRVATATEKILQQQYKEDRLVAQLLPNNITVPPQYKEQNTLLSDPEQIIATMFPCLQNDDAINAFSHNDQAMHLQISCKTSNQKNPFIRNNLEVKEPFYRDIENLHFNISHYAHSIISSDFSNSTTSSSTSQGTFIRSSTESSSSGNSSSSFSSNSSSSSSSNSSEDSTSLSSFCSTLPRNRTSIVSSTVDYTRNSAHTNILTDKQSTNDAGHRLNYSNASNINQVTSIQSHMKQKSNVDCNSTVYYEEQDYWASIVYYELNSRVGEPFLCKYPVVVVDGYTSPIDPDNMNRLSLGTFSSIHRSSMIDNTRQHVGKGIHLHHISNGIILQVYSHSPVFVQSRICNYMHGFHYNTVCKVLPGGTLKIFDFMVFANLLSNCVHHGFEAVYELTKMCTIRISFVKGWGAEYHRQDVTSTPCWIEIHVYGALKWLDNVLTQMEHPKNRISSVT